MPVRRLLKYSTAPCLGGYSLYILHRNNWDLRNLGLLRFGRAAWTVARICADYRFSVSQLTDSSPETALKWSKCHSRSAGRILKLCSLNGGLFIKVGQHLASLDYLVPSEYCATLSVLQNRAPLSSLSEMKAMVRQELGQEVDQLFDDFTPVPIGSASLAQVYKAKLRETGELVAVKIQHPRVLKHSTVDLATMDFLLKTVSKLFPSFNFRWLAEETRTNLPVELDFYNEGKNAEKMALLLAQFPWLIIPKIYWKYTTKRVLVMQYAEGDVITNRAALAHAHISPAEVVRRIEEMYSEMIFLRGRVHADPHPGNILVRKAKTGKDFEIVLLDHGLHTKLSHEFRRTYASLWMAALKGDETTLLECAKKLGIEPSKSGQMLSCLISGKPWCAVKRGLANVPDEETQAAEKAQLREEMSQNAGEISQIFATVDRQLFLLLKTNDLIRSLANKLGTDQRRSFLIMSRACFQVRQEERARATDSKWVHLALLLESQWFAFKLHVYSFYLWLTWSSKVALKKEL